VSQVTLARTKACIFWTTIPATIADTSATRVLHLEPGRASGRSDTSRPSASTRCPCPSLQAWRNTISPSSCFCINATVGEHWRSGYPNGARARLPEPLAVAGCGLFPPGPSISASAPFGRLILLLSFCADSLQAIEINGGGSFGVEFLTTSLY
jgi:hypothetical protein